MPGPLSHPLPSRCRSRAGQTLGLSLLLIPLLTSRVASEDRGQRGPVEALNPLPIAVREGTARFSVLTPDAGSRILVIVSTLSRAAGPFPVRLSARSVEPGEVQAPDLAVEPACHAEPPEVVPLPPVAEPVSTEPPAERTFSLMVRDGNVTSRDSYRAIQGRLRAVGRRIQVYVDPVDLDRVDPDALADLATTFDEQVFPVAARSLGQALDVDRDGRFTVLVSNGLTRLDGGRHPVDGYVRSADFFLNLPDPFSNHCDMMYLSASLPSGPRLRTILAHEYAHAVTLSNKAAAWTSVEEEGWLDEGLAHLVEDLYGFSRSNIDHRVHAFLDDPSRYRLIVEDYYASGLFRSHGNRGSAYLFLRWCADRDRSGPGLIARLIRSSQAGVANLESATGRSLEALYREWTVALISGAGSGGSRWQGTPPRTSSLPSGTGSASPARVSAALAEPVPPESWAQTEGGPRTTIVCPNGSTQSWDSAATASRFFIVEGSERGAIAVEVSAPADAGLQVTAIPVPTGPR
jgi:hypothetical protein